MRKIRLAYNTVSSLVLQLVTVVSGFVLPRLILTFFGSQVNGLVNSITQFLGVISFLELGVGAVVRSSLYKPLSINDNNVISQIIVSAAKYFKKIAIVLVIYIIFLMGFYPFFSKSPFGWSYTAVLIFSISISYFFQYYFGIVDGILLAADQKGYIQNIIQIITIILNIVLSVIIVNLGASIQFMKLCTSLIYLLRPIILRIYTNRHYLINRKATYTEEPIKQKWNGLAQHLSVVVLDGTDSIVLTVFSTLANVSIYSVYSLVVKGVSQVFEALINGIYPLIGDLWARQENDKLHSVFEHTEWIVHTGVTIIFSCTFILYIPFVQIYTSGISDANYIQPLFASIMVLAVAVQSLRLPYHILILAAGEYRQTQNCYFLTAAINLITSIILVKEYGLIGVACGTLIAMVFQYIYLAVYNSKHILNWPLLKSVKQLILDVCISFVCIFVWSIMSISPITYFEWVKDAVLVFMSCCIISFAVNFLFFRNRIRKFVKKYFLKF